MEISEILCRCDHTLLRVDAGLPEYYALCDEGLEYGVASVCVPPCQVSAVRSYLGARLPICTVIGFPNGYSSTPVKVREAELALSDGADEIDMVANISRIRDGSYDEVLDEIRAVKNVCGAAILKVIIETCLLTEEEKIRMCEVVSQSGADYIKTSTGFSSGGATREDVALLRLHCAPHVKVKASGGIAKLKDAEDFISLGADRLGTSRIVKLAKQMAADGGY